MPSSLKDIEYAMHGEPAPKQKKIEDYVPEPNYSKSTNSNDNGLIVFKLANANKSGGTSIQGIDYVIDPRTITDKKPEGDGPEMMRLLNGVTTIWAKEQKNLPEDYIKKNIRYIQWPKGSKFLAVPTWDVAMLQWMRLTRSNIKAPNRKTGTKTEFFEYDPTEAAMAQHAAEMLEIEMVLKANEQTEEKMKRHAFYLGIPLFDSITGAPKTEAVLRMEYILAAKRDARAFKNSFDSKEVDVQFMVRNAIVDGKIDITRGDGRIYWGSNGGVICTLPKNEQAIPYLTQLALTNSQEGRAFDKELKRTAT